MNVPIIGAAKIGDWQLTMLITCPCENQFLFTGKPAEYVQTAPDQPVTQTQAGTMVVCGKCKRVYQVAGMPERDALTGELGVNMLCRVPSSLEGK